MATTPPNIKAIMRAQALYRTLSDLERRSATSTSAMNELRAARKELASLGRPNGPTQQDIQDFSRYAGTTPSSSGLGEISGRVSSMPFDSPTDLSISRDIQRMNPLTSFSQYPGSAPVGGVTRQANIVSPFWGPGEPPAAMPRTAMPAPADVPATSTAAPTARTGVSRPGRSRVPRPVAAAPARATMAGMLPQAETGSINITAPGETTAVTDLNGNVVSRVPVEAMSGPAGPTPAQAAAIAGDVRTQGSSTGAITSGLGGTSAGRSGGRGFSVNDGFNAAFGAAGLLTSILGANQKLPEYSIPPEWRAYSNRLRDMSYQGFTPQERAAAEQDLQRNYANTASAIRGVAGGGGSSGEVIAGMAAAGDSLNRGTNALTAQDASLRRDNLGRYGQMLGTNLSLDQQAFSRQYNQTANSINAYASAIPGQIQNLQTIAMGDPNADLWDQLLSSSSDRLAQSRLITNAINKRGFN